MWTLFLKPQHSFYNSYNHRSYIPGKELWWWRGSPEEEEIDMLLWRSGQGSAGNTGEKGKKRCVTEGT